MLGFGQNARFEQYSGSPANHFGLHWRLPDRPTGLFSLRSAELIERLLMQEANLSQVSLRFRNVVPYDTQLVPDCNLARMMQRGFEALDAKLSTSGKGISLLYVVAG
jgi:hypothetical protein